MPPICWKKKKKKGKEQKKKKKRRESDLKSQGFQQKLEHNIPRPRQAELGLSHHPKADYLSQKPEMNWEKQGGMGRVDPLVMHLL